MIASAVHDFLGHAQTGLGFDLAGEFLAWQVQSGFPELAGRALARHLPARTEFLVTVLETLPVEPYDIDVAEAHGRLLAHVHRAGTARGAHDLIVAATAIATKRTVLMTHRGARFQELPVVDCLTIG